ncbi:aromatic ring-hydroxylating dioxygenase subunit alpha [Micromonospora sp. HNM0581]|uniref:aromatic ring-hydroxylating oxygenase subunit alpha n=1 Tax=Micromonospora sp. HNM0581 TaxID=2716341 RepID=UPI00146CA799|nr:aromatic ring-hydroxylating dioxygenase subunit alpha [Micromonospora sp. HNM0581]NLU78498.1 aromatic ring-hydroxylating dioxygenase subunit alpha [Micromonospora sp. HNM0581]
MSSPSPESIAGYLSAMRPFWHPVLRSVDLTDRPIHVVLLTESIVLSRLDGEVSALTNVCRHLGAALTLGDIVDGRVLRCRYHGWQYDRTGRCVDIPLRGEEKIPAQARVRRYHAQERYGLIWLCLADEPQGDLPPYPEFEDPEFHRNELVQHAEWRASVPRLVMAALDDTHFSWVHPDVLGLAGQPRLPQRLGDRPVVVSEAGVLTSRYRTSMPESPMVAESRADRGPLRTVDVEFTNVATVNSMKNVIYSDAGVSVTWNVYQPVSHDRTISFTQLSRTYDQDPAHDGLWEEFNLGIKEQDRAIVESQQPWLLPPLKAQMILYLRPEDIPLVEFQKLMERLDVPQI